MAVVAVLGSGCATGSIPWQAEEARRSQAEARGLLDRAVAAHGGDAWGEVPDVSVRYEGTWGNLVPKMQPILSDRFFRRSSLEHYWPKEGMVAQAHEGPAGEKRVLRTGETVSVAYRDAGKEAFRHADAPEKEASALVADAYALFLFGPSFIHHRADQLTMLDSETIDGRAYSRLLARLRPGFGFSDEDRVMMWIDDETGRLFRVLFSLEGFESTRGAEVDVTFLSYREEGGYWWPDDFRERVRAPVRAFAHAWRTLEIAVGSGAARPQEAWVRGGVELDVAP